MAKGIVSNTVAVPGSVPTVLHKVTQPHDLATMRVDHPTQPSKAQNTALAFSGVTTETHERVSIPARPPVTRRRKALKKAAQPYAGPAVECPVCGHHIPVTKKTVFEKK